MPIGLPVSAWLLPTIQAVGARQAGRAMGAETRQPMSTRKPEGEVSSEEWALPET